VNLEKMELLVEEEIHQLFIPKILKRVEKILVKLSNVLKEFIGEIKVKVLAKI